jgi:hypothetical protein
MDENIAILRRELAMAMAAGKVNETLRSLKAMRIEQLEALSNAELRETIDRTGLDEAGRKELELGLGKLNFYVCGILMHRILEGE